MTTDIENELAGGMSEHVDGLMLGTQVLGNAERSHRRHVAMRRTVYATAVLGLSGAVAAVTFAGNTPGGSGVNTANPPVATAQSPQLRLASAIEASANTSYQFGYSLRWAKGGGPLSAPIVGTGAFDPIAKSGWARLSDNGAEERLIKGTRYGIGTTDRSQPFIQYAGKYDNMTITSIPITGGIASADLRGMLQALKKADATVTQTSDNTFHYKYTRTEGTSKATVVGDITIGADNRVASVVASLTFPGARGEVRYDLSGYGSPVTVKVPAKVRPELGGNDTP